jgi:hypothetical protein
VGFEDLNHLALAVSLSQGKRIIAELRMEFGKTLVTPRVCSYLRLSAMLRSLKRSRDKALDVHSLPTSSLAFTSAPPDKSSMTTSRKR